MTTATPHERRKLRAERKAQQTERRKAQIAAGRAERRYFVYRVYDIAGDLLYIGCTCDPTTRWREHGYVSQWAKYAVRFRMQGPYFYATAARMEREAQIAEDPYFGWTPQRWSAFHATAPGSKERAQFDDAIREGTFRAYS